VLSFAKLPANQQEQALSVRLHEDWGLLRYAPYLKRLPNVIQTYGNAILVSSQGSSAVGWTAPNL
jgi:hypothetical protein